LARENIKTFVDNGVKKSWLLPSLLPHPSRTEYPEFKVNFDVVHVSQYLFQLINEGKLKLTKEYRKKVTFP